MSDNFTRTFPDTAVYWGNPQADGYGGQTYDDPIEIPCRWEQVSLVEVSIKGKQVMARHEVYTDQDVDEEGVLFKGLLTDFDESAYSTPLAIPGAESIIRFNKIPNVRGTKFLRKAYLGRLWTGK